MDSIETILAREFLELRVGVPVILGNNDITESEIIESLKYIREQRLIQDAQSLLSGINPMRNSVSYPLIFPNQERELFFRVDWFLKMRVYCGKIQTQNTMGNELTQVRLYDLVLRE